jgi:hypothetical protein
MAETKAPGKAPVKKSIASEVVIGKAAQDLTKAVAEISKALDGVKSLESRTEDLSLQISNKEAEIAQLDLDFKEKQRQMALDLELKMKGDAEATVTEYLRSKGRQAVAVTEYTEMTETIAKSRAEFEKTLASEIAKTAAMERSRYEAEKKLLEANQKAEQAANDAAIKALEQQVKFHETQSNIWKQQLEAERAASVERAKAGSIGNINLGGDPSRR